MVLKKIGTWESKVENSSFLFKNTPLQKAKNNATWVMKMYAPFLSIFSFNFVLLTFSARPMVWIQQSIFFSLSDYNYSFPFFLLKEALFSFSVCLLSFLVSLISLTYLSLRLNRRCFPLFRSYSSSSRPVHYSCFVELAYFLVKKFPKKNKSTTPRSFIHYFFSIRSTSNPSPPPNFKRKMRRKMTT